MFTTDSTVRAEFIAGLRRLADFLATHPKVPVPSDGTEFSIHVHDRATVDRIAALIDRPASDGLDYQTTRDFGPISYRAAVPAPPAYDWDILLSPYGQVTA